MAIVWAFAIASPAVAITRPSAAIVLDPRAGPPTTWLIVTGNGFGPNEAVKVFFGKKARATSQTESDGSFSAYFDVPRNASPGKHTVKAKGESSGLTAKATFRVRTDWAQFRYEPSHSGTNPYENVLSPKNVGQLKVKWKHLLATHTESSAAVVDGVVYIGDDANDLYALRASTGKELWRYTVSGDYVRAPAVGDGAVYISYANGVDAIDAATGKMLWHVQVFNPTEVSVSDGLVYFGSFLGGLYAVDAKSGERRWLDSTGPIASSPAVAENTVYVGSDDHNIYAIDALTGAKRWTFPTGDRVRSSPAVADGLVYVGSDDGRLYALDDGTGQKSWSFVTAHGYVESSPAVSDGVVYVGANKGVYAIKGSDGTPVWAYKTLVNVRSSPALANGVVYVGSPVNRHAALVAIKASTGVVLWSHKMTDYVGSSPVVVDGVVYVGGPDGYAYAFSS